METVTGALWPISQICCQLLTIATAWGCGCDYSWTNYQYQQSFLAPNCMMGCMRQHGLLCTLRDHPPTKNHICPQELLYQQHSKSHVNSHSPTSSVSILCLELWFWAKKVVATQGTAKEREREGRGGVEWKKYKLIRTEFEVGKEIAAAHWGALRVCFQNLASNMTVITTVLDFVLPPTSM